MVTSAARSAQSLPSYFNLGLTYLLCLQLISTRAGQGQRQTDVLQSDHYVLQSDQYVLQSDQYARVTKRHKAADRQNDLTSTTKRFESKMGRMMLVIRVTLLVVMADHCTSGARCRFASTSASRGSCIFPCRCTNGCNTTTGECIKGGQCEDGHPSGYRWSGQACQTGNVAYGKTTSQTGGGSIYAAEKAVDGNTDPLIYHRHCAFPAAPTGTNAWWMVDFGERYSISRVVIYNRGDCCNQQLDTFVLSVGDSDDRQSQRECARHNGRVRLSGKVEKTCNAVAQYLSFRRNGGYQSHVTTLCEVVVIGHTYIDCQQCPRGTACNDVIGCDTCAPGKQQPDCVKVCDEGSYGVNCQNDCGNCKDRSPCNVTNGRCTNGCKLCSSAVVSWPKANGIPSGLEAHYYYVVWLQADGETEREVAQIVQDADGNKLGSPIPGLMFNTHYSVKIEPYRQHNETHEGGSTTNVATFKTSYIAPTTPVITNVTKSTPNVNLRTSSVKAMFYKCAPANKVGSVKATFYKCGPVIKVGPVKAMFLLEQLIHLLAVLVKPFLRFPRGPNMLATTVLPEKTLSNNAASNSTAAGLGKGTLIVVLVAMFLLGALVATGVMLIVFRMWSIMAKPDHSDQQRERHGSAADVVIDEQGYVVPPRLSRQQEDAIEDEGDYVHPPTVAGQQEQANVYDFINPTA
ncbi:hypothetical protein LSAT2_018886 [Lamellibrachia satsuma]|nr:hypothetical protein LSAT2_018886 [Lamellibrachia satsuma]